MLPTHLPATGQSAIMLTQNCFPVESVKLAYFFDFFFIQLYCADHVLSTTGHALTWDCYDRALICKLDHLLVYIFTSYNF